MMPPTNNSNSSGRTQQHAAGAAAEPTSHRLAHSSLLHRHAGGDSSAAHHHQQQQPAHHQYHPAAAVHRLHQQQLHRVQLEQYYMEDDISHLDCVFYVIHLVMSAVHKRMLVTPREQWGFQVALATFAGALLMRLFFKPLYARVRPQLVFVVHVVITLIRAAVVNSMASKQAIHGRGGVMTETYHTAVVLAMTMLAILGGPLRLFEMLGLQQPWRSHALITALYLVCHPLFAATGIRLAFSNSMFYQVHAVHDGVSATVEGLLSFVTGLPGQQQTCSSCAGVAVYSFMCLFGSVAVPLYVMYVWEQAAVKRWVQQLTPPTAAAGAAAGAGVAGAGVLNSAAATAVNQGAAQSGAQSISSDDLVCLHERANGNGGSSSNSSSNSSGSSSSGGGSSSELGSTSTSSGSGGSRAMTSLEALCLQAEAAAAAHNAGCQQSIPSFNALVTSDVLLIRWCVHLSVMLCLLVGCWAVSNMVALVLLPRVLSRFQLDRWCPNRPFAPYVIAGQIYHEGL